MKNLLFFSRCELVNLYGRLSPYIAKKYNIVHLAYSDKEEEILKNQYGINEVINFKKETKKIYDKEQLNPKLLSVIDELFIRESKGRFSINSSIRFDRTYHYLTYEECLLMSQVYYRFWDRIFDEYSIDFMLHEPPAIFLTHVASNICKQKGIKYFIQTQVIGRNKYNWMFVEGDNGFPEEIAINLDNSEISNDDIEKVNSFLSDYRDNSKILFPEISSNYKNDRQSTIKFILKCGKIVIRSLLNRFKRKNENIFSAIEHIEAYLYKKQQTAITKLYNYWKLIYKMKYDIFDENVDYYYYPLHTEPEAAVLYRGDGIYENQVKLIENIAEQLPPQCYLYIKDHPHRPAFEDIIYYDRIRLIPNVKLIHPSVIGMSITANARGIITINGTSGFEALLLNKQVYTFGNVYYNLSNRVLNIRNIRDLRSILYENYNKTFNDDDDLRKFVLAFLKSSHEGFTSYFPSSVKLCGINHDTNSKIVSTEMIKAIRLIDSQT